MYVWPDDRERRLVVRLHHNGHRSGSILNTPTCICTRSAGHLNQRFDVTERERQINGSNVGDIRRDIQRENAVYLSINQPDD